MRAGADQGRKMNARKRRRLLKLFKAAYYGDDPQDGVYDDYEDGFVYLVREGYFDRELVNVTGNNKLNIVRRTSRSPLSEKGQQELDTSVYERIRSSLPVRIVSDMMLGAAFAASVYLTLREMAGG